MSHSEDAAAPGAGLSEGGTGVQVGGTDRRHQCIALPRRPKLSDKAERLLAQLKPADYRSRSTLVAPRRLPRIGDVQVVGQLVMRVPDDARSWEIRALFGRLQSLPDGVSVTVQLPARQWVALDDALAGLDDLPTLELVVEGPVQDFARVAAAVTALRASAARRAVELQAVAS